MYSVDTKITLHIQVLVYCKKCSYPLDCGPTQNLSNLFYTAKKNRWQLMQVKIYMMQSSTCILATFALA